MKTYYLYYESITGAKYTQHFETLFALGNAIEQLLDNSFANEASVKVWTEDKG